MLWPVSAASHVVGGWLQLQLPSRGLCFGRLAEFSLDLLEPCKLFYSNGSHGPTANDEYDQRDVWFHQELEARYQLLVTRAEDAQLHL